MDAKQFRLSAVAIQGGYGTDSVGNALSIDHRLITGNLGNGVFADGGSVTVTDSAITSNVGAGLSSYRDVIVKDSGIGNSSYGVFAATLTIERCTISGNSVYGSPFPGGGGAFGGGIAACGVVLTIDSSAIDGNSGNYGGVWAESCTLTVKDSSISGNLIGGGLWASNSTATIDHSTLHDNDLGVVIFQSTVRVKQTLVEGVFYQDRYLT